MSKRRIPMDEENLHDVLFETTLLRFEIGKLTKNAYRLCAAAKSMDLEEAHELDCYAQANNISKLSRDIETYFGILSMVLDNAQIDIKHIISARKTYKKVKDERAKNAQNSERQKRYRERAKESVQ